MSRSCTACGHSFVYTIDGTEYSREVLMEVAGVYDGGLFYACPVCGHRRHRWPVGSDLRERARPYVEHLDPA